MDAPLTFAAWTSALTIRGFTVLPSSHAVPIELWLRIATLCVGLLTGLGSGGLVLLKYYDRWRGRHRSDPAS